MGCSGGTQDALVSQIFFTKHAKINVERVLTIKKNGESAKRVVLAEVGAGS